ncbi:Multidrug resistance-associated protein 1 [Actinomortierella ambigua]|nr:Multidrug resistance-associated protein 1 [Actinomortierella ambigua]
MIAWALACVLMYLESQRSIRSSDFIFAYALISLMTTAIYLRTLHDTNRFPTGDSVTMCVYLAALVVGFLVEAWPRGAVALTTKGLPATAYDTANLFSRVIFHYIQPVISKGYRQPLTQSDLDNMMPSSMLSATAYPQLSAVWSAHVAKHPTNPSMIKVFVKWGGMAWLPMFLSALINSTFAYCNPILLGELVSFVGSYTGDDATAKPLSLGLILAFALFFSTMMIAMADGQSFQLGVNIGSELRTGLISLIYRKALVLSTGARQSMTVGEITNRMAVDCERIANALRFTPMAMVLPFDLAVGIWLRVLVLTAPAQALLGKVMNKGKDQKLAAMDDRIRIINEILAGIKITKLYGWEDSFRKRINAIRDTELKALRKIGTVTAFMMIMFSSLPSLMTMVSLGVYAAVGGEGLTRGTITAEKIFVTVSLFNRLAGPIGRMSLIITQAISLNVASTRIGTYLLAEETNDTQVLRQLGDVATPGSAEAEKHIDKDSSIVIHAGTFAWSLEPGQESVLQKIAKTVEMKEKKDAGDEKERTPSPVSTDPVLIDINLRVPRGNLSVIVGRVGQGKSSLISALMGEMYKRRGVVYLHGSVGYVPQQAWIFNATLKDNIIFGMPFDQEKYDRIVFACGLKPDLEMLPAGDLTEIGERGINLSGGQKQRVSLARAAYQDADVYLLDDPLSAVDAHVDQHLWMNLIGPEGMLKDKTRLLVTHGVHHLSEADQIIVVKDGKINESGQYKDLMEAEGSLFQLIQEYSIKSQSDSTSGNASESITEMDPGNAISRTTDGDKHQESQQTRVEAQKTAGNASKVEQSDNDENAKLVQEEEMMTGSVGWKVFFMYAKACSLLYAFMAPFGFVASQAFQVGASKWLEVWSGAEDRSSNIEKYLGVYAALVAGYILFDIFVNWSIFCLAGIRASRDLHKNLISKILTLPMSFFDTTPTGRILNRFSSDMDNVDELLPYHTSDLFYFMTAVLGTLVVISMSVPIFIAFIPVVVIVYAYVQVYYMRASRSLKRLASIAKSPMYSHFSETLTGVMSIRAMGVSDRFIETNARHSDKAANANFAYMTATRWLHSRLEILGAFIILAVGLLSVLGRKSINPGIAGLALTYALNITWQTSYMVEAFCEFQNQLVSVERINSYIGLQPEAPHDLDGDKSLPDQWPQHGHVEFRNYSTRYREGLELVVKNITFEVQPGEKIGIVGRTGAGKSSLTLALFRIIEAANSVWAKAVAANYTTCLDGSEKQDSKEAVVNLEQVTVEEDGGSIWIDGVDIATVGLNFLRQHLAIIPQDPTLFAGSLRENLDPFNECTDADLWEALERAHLKDHISTLAGGLTYEVAQNGENFSVGQRSLICLARALLRKTKILVLDEATSSVDMETDELIQRTIRTEFKDRTILTIAHRIKTVMDYDKILVLEKGRVCEFEPPKTLLQNEDSLFYKLAKQAGEVA